MRCWFLWLASTLALAQESALQAELRREGERVSDACETFSFKSVPGCAYTLFTDHPLHIAAGSMPPQNGFGLGGAFVWSKNTRNWRMSWDFDAVGAVEWGVARGWVHEDGPHPAFETKARSLSQSQRRVRLRKKRRSLSHRNVSPIPTRSSTSTRSRFR